VNVDLAVVGRDPLFGGGGLAQTNAFIDGARELGRDPILVYDAHPGLRGPRVSWRRVEALRQRTAHRRTDVRHARSIWVVSTHATDGGPALDAHKPFACWIGTTVEAEWAGRAPALSTPRRVLAAIGSGQLRSQERRVLTQASCVYATSLSSRDAVASASGRDDIKIMRIPIDTRLFSPAPDEEWRRSLATPTVVFVGRGDDPRKNVGLLVATARRLPDVRVILVGVPPRGLLPPNVLSTGFVTDVVPQLRRGTVFALPSRQEGFGIVVAEALAAGLPVVTTPSAGPEELVTSSGGGVVTSTFDVDEFASTVASLLADPQRLEEMRRRGRAYVAAEHSPERFRRDLSAALLSTE
jgi:glycosyltransferase involved in cell wall biosynthesis